MQLFVLFVEHVIWVHHPVEEMVGGFGLRCYSLLNYHFNLPSGKDDGKLWATKASHGIVLGLDIFSLTQ